MARWRVLHVIIFSCYRSASILGCLLGWHHENILKTEQLFQFIHKSSIELLIKIQNLLFFMYLLIINYVSYLIFHLIIQLIVLYVFTVYQVRTYLLIFVEKNTSYACKLVKLEKTWRATNFTDRNNFMLKCKQNNRDN